MHPIQRLRYARQAGIDTFNASTIKRVTVVITTATTKEIQGVTSNRASRSSADAQSQIEYLQLILAMVLA